jgi:2'-5' RNA ligase
MKRLFAAIKIEPGEKYLQLFSELKNQLKHERIKWVEPQFTHLTLKFFGETSDDLIPAIHQCISNTAARHSVFRLHISRTGIFGSRYDPRVIWFGIDYEKSLHMLASDFTTELAEKGWQADRQNFVPHLTLARIKELNDKALFQQIINKYSAEYIQHQQVTGITLYESILKPTGPVYIKLFEGLLKT